MIKLGLTIYISNKAVVGLMNIAICIEGATFVFMVYPLIDTNVGLLMGGDGVPCVRDTDIYHHLAMSGAQ